MHAHFSLFPQIRGICCIGKEFKGKAFDSDRLRLITLLQLLLFV
jgi:hypothetical protein